MPYVLHGRADDNGDALDSLEFNETITRIAAMFGPGYVQFFQACRNTARFRKAKSGGPSSRGWCVVLYMFGRLFISRRFVRTTADVHDERYADALYQFSVYLFENRGGSRHDMSGVADPKPKGPVAVRRKQK